MPGEWHVLLILLGPKNSTVDDIADCAIYVRTLCEQTFFKNMVQGRTTQPKKGEGPPCPNCYVRAVQVHARSRG